MATLVNMQTEEYTDDHVPLTEASELLASRLSTLEIVILFGSYGDGSANESSDLDIAILTGEPIDSVTRWNLQNELAQLAGMDVDLVDLRGASTVLKMQIADKGQLIWGRESIYEKFAVNTMTMYQHLQQERKEILHAFNRDNFCE
ncbi:type VII toxin-antitoxin system MntA family adenylyltransferase antitoxin [Alkalimarinus coralli]|uniref:type VII toxin-antitoxin system MntA family adenylyltransferase antitoxin n=1 Tax=Alkalimarinus coralli TaxID=2935863 RepID=UPI00202B67AE|nr:nucleotidyltransferase domain-containing protein [Alkalimarinus coralli]